MSTRTCVFMSQSTVSTTVDITDCRIASFNNVYSLSHTYVIHLTIHFTQCVCDLDFKFTYVYMFLGTFNPHMYSKCIHQYGI